MALLTEAGRRKRFIYLGLGDYNKENIMKFQKIAFGDARQHDSVYGKATDRALRHFYNVRKCAPSFKPSEFKCTCGHCTGYPSYMKQVELKHLQRIRDHYKKPMIITSGLRCSYENSRVGGVANSGHLKGYAADFYMQGVTDSVAHRQKVMRWIVKQPNHEFTYGANMRDSNGLYRTAASMGNAMHTETHKPQPTLTDKLLAACKEQSEWQKNYKYGWESHPTIPKSKKKGTCVTYVACVLQRIGYLKSGQYIWHNGRGYGTGKVRGANDKMAVKYMKNKSLTALKSKLKAGDIIMLDDNKSGQSGGGGHIFILTGKWKGGDPYIWDNETAHKKQKPRVYSGSRKVLARVRLK